MPISIHKMSETSRGRIAEIHGVDQALFELLEGTWEHFWRRLVKEFGMPARLLRHKTATITRMSPSLKSPFVYYWNTGVLLNCDLSVGKVQVTLYDVRDMFLALGVVETVAPIEAIFFAETLRTLVLSDPPSEWQGHKYMKRQEFWMYVKFKELAKAAEERLPFETETEFIPGHYVTKDEVH